MIDKKKDDATKRDVSDAIGVEAPVVLFRRPVAVVAPTAAARLAELPGDERKAAVERMLELGAKAINAYQTNATVRLLEGRLDGLDAQLQERLSVALRKDRETAKEEMGRLLHEHALETTRVMMRFTDPKSEDAFPAVMTSG